MCGIVGYVGERNAVEVLMDGLRRLEYRGYDSAGVAVLGRDGLAVRRRVGKVKALQEMLRAAPVSGHVGLGHTRWATHGRPSEENAHPHLDCRSEVAVVHNGILENYLPLKQRLEAEGHRFRSETDTEVVAHLVEAYLRDFPGIEAAVQRALQDIRGAYALGVLWVGSPDRLVAAKRGAGGVVLGIGRSEMFLASDLAAVLGQTREAVVLEDGEIAVVTPTEWRLATFEGTPVERAPIEILWDPGTVGKGGFRHFMLKEIHEQPRAVADTVRERVQTDTGVVALGDDRLESVTRRPIQRVLMVACGTSFHAAAVGRYLMEHLAGIPTEIDLASEFRYRGSPIGPETLVVAISQSGETADTLGAVKTAGERGSPTLVITNVVGSALARDAGAVLYTRAGPEIGVASTKTFTATVAACYLLAVAIGSVRGTLAPEEVRKRVQDLVEVPSLMEATLGISADAADVARELARYRSFLYLGRGIHYPMALEGALKLKELSYLHAEGYAAGEMKHGPIALIDPRTPVVAVVPRDRTYERMLANLQEVRARDAKVIAIADTGDYEIESLADRVLRIPPVEELLSPLVTALPLQLLAYHVAVRRGCDVDQPRNLAKSVTVE
jgi:glucosamine--fructose-6-phosphate aminotransferase (isomerizing)